MNDEKWMRLALEEARKAAEAGEIPVGALIGTKVRRSRPMRKVTLLPILIFQALIALPLVVAVVVAFLVDDALAGVREVG